MTISEPVSVRSTTDSTFRITFDSVMFDEMTVTKWTMCWIVLISSADQGKGQGEEERRQDPAAREDDPLEGAFQRPEIHALSSFPPCVSILLPHRAAPGNSRQRQAALQPPNFVSASDNGPRRSDGGQNGRPQR